MFNILKYRTKYLNQNIPDIRKAKINQKHRGLPKIVTNCIDGCKECISVCPSNAISVKPFSIDLGKCVFCGECERICTNNSIKISNFHKLSSTERNRLIIDGSSDEKLFYANAVKKLPQDFFRKSLKIRQVSAGGCNGCEMELNACSNVNFDMQRYGIDVVASPRHADCLLITGPVTANMAKALYDTYRCMPEPKLVILAGACAISGGVFAESDVLNREFIDTVKINLFIPGCPVHPLTVINGLLDLLGRR